MTALVSAQAGALRGRVAEDHEQFLGIPYALPPVGPRRFLPPEPVPAWRGVREAADFGPVCPQRFDEADRLFGASDQPQSEADCLTLNVWRPLGARAGDRLPVMVWIHGGALVGGAASWEPYRGDSFARDGVILVGINYRLHALGFLDLSAHFPGHERSINLGLQDATLALRWIRRNIAAFGGDPDTVTVFGESAGGALVSALVAAPQARGLFRRAIMESGTAVVLHDRETSATIGANALRRWGVEPGDRRALEALPIEAVLSVLDANLMEGASGVAAFPWILTRDAAGLDLTALEAVVAGRADGLELILGWTVDEYRLRWLGQDPPEPEVPAVPLERVPEAFAAAAAALYGELLPGASPARVEEKIANDQHFLAPALAIAEAHAARGGSARLYEFRWPSPVQGGALGSCHALELPFVFDLAVGPAFHGADPLPPALVSAMHGAWMSFAAGDEPTVGGRAWPEYAARDAALATFDEESGIESLHPELRELWRRAEPDWMGIA